MVETGSSDILGYLSWKTLHKYLKKTMQICHDFIWLKQQNLHKIRKSCISHKFMVH